jgi:phosphatidate cytidylyltransferase
VPNTRLVSAAVMVPFVAGGILYLPTAGVALALALIMGAGLWEWGRMIPLRSVAARLAYPVAVVGLMALVWVMPVDRVITPLLLVAFVWWLAALYWLVHPGFGAEPTAAVRLLKGIVGGVVMLPSWAAFVTLHGRGDHGPVICLALLVLVWLADSGAYFAGRRWGHTRLAPLISPGKTWEGMLGGIVAGGIFILAAGYWYSRSVGWTLTLGVVSLLVVMFSIVGDLLESLMKRQAGLKDSGHIIPGHGGILDRIDSLTAAAPLFLLGMLWFKL